MMKFLKIFSLAMFAFLGLGTYEQASASIFNDQPNSHVMQLAVDGYKWAKAHGEVGNSSVITIVDFSLPSAAYRMWVMNLKTNQVLMKLRVCQGKNSGLYTASRFSNEPRSLESSLGIFRTGDVYDGKHGLSERLYGLENGINSNALRRAIIIHSAWYATSSFVHEYHRTGSSWGCFAVDPGQVSSLIHLVHGGSILFAYASPENHDSNLLKYQA